MSHNIGHGLHGSRLSVDENRVLHELTSATPGASKDPTSRSAIFRGHLA
jgi:hypothetical protein